MSTGDGAARRPPVDFLPTAGELLRRGAARFGNRPLIIDPASSATYADVDAWSRALAGRLVAHGVGKATRVGLLLTQTALWPTAFFAAARIGALVCPFSTFFKPAELRRAVAHGDIEILVVPPSLLGRDTGGYLAEAVPELADAGPGPLLIPALPSLRAILVLDRTDDGPALRRHAGREADGEPSSEFVSALAERVHPADELVAIFTSGSTATPKAVVHTHGSQIRHAVNLAELRDAAADSMVFAVMPFFWVGGLNSTLFTCVYAGSSIICQERFATGEALDLIERYRPTSIRAWPNAVERLKADPTFAGRRLDEIGFLHRPLTSPRRHGSLGMTETCGPHSSASRAEQAVTLDERHAGSFGPAVPYVERKVVDPASGAEVPDGTSGEVCIRGYSLMERLVRVEREDTFDADGWYHTGDRARVRDGLVFFEGRISTMIKTGGSNVSPSEVAAVLETIDGVHSCHVVGVDDPHRMEVVAAAVVTDRPDLTPKRIRSEATKLLSSYKVPRRILLLGPHEVPVLGSGKPDLLALRDRLAALSDLDA